MNLNNTADYATIIASIIAIITVLFGFLEYRRQGAQKRVEYFIKLRDKFTENKLFKEMLEELDNNSPQIAHRPFKEKRELLGFFEDIALITNSEFIHKHIVHYMFGYYIIRCWKSDNFWSDLNRNSPYWALFKYFAEEMEQFEESFSFEPKKYRL